MNKEEFESKVVEVKDVDWGMNENEIRFFHSKLSALNECMLTVTRSKYSQKNLEAINKFIAENKGLFHGWKQQYNEYLKSNAGRLRIAKEKAVELAVKAGLVHDEHGGYSRGDHHTLIVVDVVYNKILLKKLKASGKNLALVEDFRKRIYSKQYTSRYGDGERSDKYLVGTNENGVPFVHGVSRNCKTVDDAVKWIWNEMEVMYRHGDIGLSVSTLKNVSGEYVIDKVVMDNHHYTGEMYISKSGMFVRNGVLFHLKEQHPDVKVGNSWMKVVIAKRAAVGGSKD